MVDKVALVGICGPSCRRRSAMALADRGDMVRRDQELATIDTSAERVLAEGGKYRSEMAAAVRAGQTRVQLSERRLARAQELHSQQFIAQLELPNKDARMLAGVRPRNRPAAPRAQPAGLRQL